MKRKVEWEHRPKVCPHLCDESPRGPKDFCSALIGPHCTRPDLVDDGNGYGSTGHGAPIYAIGDGEIFRGTDGAGGKNAIIKHSDDFYSAYWHLQ